MANLNYTGRSVDVLIAQGLRETGMRLLTLSWGGDTGGQIITGVQKAAQLFMLVFLTRKGSRVHDPDFGTRFLTTLQTANINDSLLQLTFRDAAEDVLRQQGIYREASAPNDEIIANIELISFSTPNPSEISLTVRLTTRDGATRQVIMPISLAIK